MPAWLVSLVIGVVGKLVTPIIENAFKAKEAGKKVVRKVRDRKKKVEESLDDAAN